ncbi:hypothetical protein AT05_00285 [Schleiferia thermophila str. Yellowstone]|nr:hypothetical protein AT05_00285 [Schleiferia thermophila str. Yellowstone]
MFAEALAQVFFNMLFTSIYTRPSFAVKIKKQ